MKRNEDASRVERRLKRPSLHLETKNIKSRIMLLSLDRLADRLFKKKGENTEQNADMQKDNKL